MEDSWNSSSNASNSTSELQWLVQDRLTGQVTAAFLLLILVVGLPWNLLVVLTIVKEKLYHQPTILLLLNLAVNDFLWMMLKTVSQIVTGFAGEYVFGDTDVMRFRFCSTGRVSLMIIYISLSTIALMSFDRFLFIYKPLHYEKIVTSCRVVIVLVIVWTVMAGLTVVAPLVAGEDLVFSPPFLMCVLNFSAKSRYIILPLGAVIVLSLVVFNVWVVVIVWRNIRAIYKVRCTLSSEREREGHQKELCKSIRKKRHQKQLHLFHVFGALLGSTLITWLPVIALFSFLLFSGRAAPHQLISAFYIIFITQLAVHPILETVLIKDVREPMKHFVLFCCFWKRKKYQDSEEKSDEVSLQGCRAVFLNMLHASIVEHSKHSNHGDYPHGNQPNGS